MNNSEDSRSNSHLQAVLARKGCSLFVMAAVFFRQRSESEKMSTHQSITILEGLFYARQQIISLRFKEVKRKIILGSLLALKFWDYCL